MGAKRQTAPSPRPPQLLTIENLRRAKRRREETIRQMRLHLPIISEALKRVAAMQDRLTRLVRVIDSALSLMEDNTP